MRILKQVVFWVEEVDPVVLPIEAIRPENKSSFIIYYILMVLIATMTEDIKDEGLMV